ncbi:hypothetical protein [Methylobacterium oxalidis]|uniref:Uncharacterized protein n=1 Tax=Methylobacterium oxalidis TaxID=944322 RepID=A0A512J969_9HYPH|nr:hypothetical protein [Methylobacterium oxalidis]GEP06455.1 hypothetical protein MOX02_44930 [Methylobacterium oxalidis]GJE33522.1 hypothetical protein LDDCCGHA_3722 [Methylobacterium oxalidis]GLS65495.1 hypothetical protein GCM10007888_38770 [Methylobacterium oxalidis]
MARETIQARQRALIQNLRTASDIVAAAERDIDRLIERLAQGDLAGIGRKPIDELALKQAVAALGHARVQRAKLREVLLDAAVGLDADDEDDLSVALRDLFDRLTAPTHYDEAREHGLGYAQLLGGRA